MKHYSDFTFLNFRTGEDVTIEDFARLVSEVVGYKGEIVFDAFRADGPPQKSLDVSKIKKLG
jgi:GDP-L-fucose synthase